MSLSLDDLKLEIDEYHNRIEEVLSGMDVFLGKLDRRVTILEGQLSALAAALTDEPEISLSNNVSQELASLKTDISSSRSGIRGKQ